MGYEVIARFKVSFEGWSEAGQTYPIHLTGGALIGAFTVSEGPVWNCFIARGGYEEAIFFNSGVYANPTYGDRNEIVSMTISERPESDFSRKVYPVPEE